MSEVMIFLKAQIKGGAAGDLFAAPVIVEGHAKGARYIAPYVAIRHKSVPGAAVAPVLLVPTAPDDAGFGPSQGEVLTVPPEPPDDGGERVNGWATGPSATLQPLQLARRDARVDLEAKAKELRIYGADTRRNPECVALQVALDATNAAVAAEEIRLRWCQPSTSASIHALYGLPDKGKVYHYTVMENYISGKGRPRDICIRTSDSRDPTKPSSFTPDMKATVRWENGAPQFQLWDRIDETASHTGGWDKRRHKPKSLTEFQAYLTKKDDEMAAWVAGAPARNAAWEAERDAAANPPPTPAMAGPLPLVEHVTKKGKTIRGVVRKDLTREQAKAIDEYTFAKDGGFFIREAHLGAADVERSAVAVRPFPAEAAAEHADLAAMRAKLAGYQALKYKTAVAERMIPVYEARLAANPAKWAIGHGASYKPTHDQTNRGYRVVDVDPDRKALLLRQVADTGMTSTGGHNDRFGDEWVYMGDARRDRKYDR